MVGKASIVLGVALMGALAAVLAGDIGGGLPWLALSGGLVAPILVAALARGSIRPTTTALLAMAMVLWGAVMLFWLRPLTVDASPPLNCGSALLPAGGRHAEGPCFPITVAQFNAGAWPAIAASACSMLAWLSCLTDARRAKQDGDDESAQTAELK